MKNANRNIALAAVAALTLSVVAVSLKNVRVHLNLPLPPSPGQVLRNLPAPPMLRVADRDRGGRYDDRDRGYDNRDRRYDGRRNDRNRNDGRWNYQNRYRNDRYSSYHDRYRSYNENRYRSYGNNYYRGDRYRGRGLRVWVNGGWVLPPFPGAVWVDGYYDEYGDWIPGQWVASW